MRTLRLTVLKFGVGILSTALVSSALAQTPVNRYSFDEPTDGPKTTVTDSIGGAHGEVIVEDEGNFGYVNGELDLSSNIGERSNEIFDDAYVDLPNGVITAAVNSGTSGAISLEWWATVTETHTWSRFGDFGSSNEGEDTSVNGNQSEYILVTPNSGRFGNGLEITNHPASNAAEPNVGVQGPFELDEEAHVVAIYDHTDKEFGDNGTMHLYLDGEIQGSNEIHEDVNLNEMVDDNNWLGRSQWNDPLFVGRFNEFRIYDVALSEAEVDASFKAGPDAEIGGGVVGDFNGNGELEPGDLDTMVLGDATFDLDGDGDSDTDDRLHWIVELAKTWAGDSNFDGEFSSGDLVTIFTAGKFETGEAATWAEGDWDGDKLFGTGDLVFAFSAGGFELGPQEGAASAVPEPTGLTLILIAFCGLVWKRRR